MQRFFSFVFTLCIDNIGVFPAGSDSKESAYNVGDQDSIPGSGDW